MRKLLAVLVLCFVGFSIWRFVESRYGAETEDAGGNSIQQPSWVAHTGNTQSVRLSETSSTAIGIEAQSLQNTAIPDSALVWFNGKSYVYVEMEPRNFIKTEVSIKSFRDGFYEVNGLPQQARIAVGGAQMLFSEEQRSSGETGE